MLSIGVGKKKIELYEKIVCQLCERGFLAGRGLPRLNQRIRQCYKCTANKQKGGN